MVSPSVAFSVGALSALPSSSLPPNTLSIPRQPLLPSAIGSLITSHCLTSGHAFAIPVIQFFIAPNKASRFSSAVLNVYVVLLVRRGVAPILNLAEDFLVQNYTSSI